MPILDSLTGVSLNSVALTAPFAACKIQSGGNQPKRSERTYLSGSLPVPIRFPSDTRCACISDLGKFEVNGNGGRRVDRPAAFKARKLFRFLRVGTRRNALVFRLATSDTHCSGRIQRIDGLYFPRLENAATYPLDSYMSIPCRENLSQTFPLLALKS